MKKLLFILTLVLCTSAAEARSPTCRLQVDLQDGAKSYGSGTAYHKNKDGVFVITCKHIIRGAKLVPVGNCNGSMCNQVNYVFARASFEHGNYNAWIYATHPTEDLALAFIPLRGLKPNFYVTPVASFTPNPGEPCFAQGHPNGQPSLVTIHGQVLSNNNLSFPAQQGMSGGGVFQKSRLVGVVVTTDYTNCQFVPVPIIRDMTNRAYVFQMVEGPINLEAVQPKDPELPTEPTDPKVPAEPTGPKVPAEPTGPKVPIEPTDPKVPNDDKIDKIENTIKLIGTLANYAIPGAGIIGGLLGTGLGYVLRRRSKAPQISKPRLRSKAPQVSKPRFRVQPTTQVQEVQPAPQVQPVPQPVPQVQPTMRVQEVQPVPQPYPVVYSVPPHPQVVHTESYPVKVEVDEWSKRFAWAKGQMCQKEPGAIGTIERLESFMKQCKF